MNCVFDVAKGTLNSREWNTREWKSQKRETMESEHFNNMLLNALYVNSERQSLKDRTLRPTLPEQRQKDD